MKKVIIFDFDGTIVDSQKKILEIANRFSKEFGYPTVEDSDLGEIKNLSSREIIRRSGISLFKIPFLLGRVKEELGKEIEYIQPISGIEKSLWDLKKRDYQLGIITSNGKDNVLKFLEKHNLENLFSFIYSSIAIFGKHKIIKKAIDKNNFTKDRVFYVGDETRDIEAAKKSKIKIISVAWGFNSSSVLQEYQPDFLIHHPEELIKAIDNQLDGKIHNQQWKSQTQPNPMIINQG